MVDEIRQRRRRSRVAGGARGGHEIRRPPGVSHREHPVEPAQLEGAVVPHPVATHVRHRKQRDHRLDERRSGDRERMLGPAFVGGADRADAAVGPRLMSDPLRGVVAVTAVVGQRPPTTLRAVAPAHVLHDHDVATGSEVVREGRGAHLLVVRRAHQQRREPAFNGYAVARRPIHVGGERSTIAHRDHDIDRERDVAGRFGRHRRRRRRQQSRQHDARREQLPAKGS